MRYITKKIFLLAVFFIFSGRGALAATSGQSPCDQNFGDPHYKCLPSELSTKFIKSSKYIPLFTPPEPPPIAEMHDNGVVGGLSSYMDYDPAFKKRVHQIFVDDHFVHLPSGSQIIEREVLTKYMTIDEDFRSPQRKRIWEFPVGFEVVHRIFWKETKEVFEVRVLRKLPGGRWASGVYDPDPANKTRLILRTWKIPTLKKEVVIQEGSQKTAIQVELPRLGPNSCRECHSSHGQSYQYGIGLAHKERVDFVGPCGLSPEIPKQFRQYFEKSFFLKYNYWPISVR